MLIHFHTFRHWKAATEQHKTKDSWHVKIILGHKSITSTGSEKENSQWIIKKAMV
jgi:integrase